MHRYRLSGKQVRDTMMSIRHRLAKFDLRRIRVHDFVREMDLAYAAADVVVSRSGALAVSEICIAKKPVILVPSPNVAEDHQTKNAKALGMIRVQHYWYWIKKPVRNWWMKHLSFCSISSALKNSVRILQHWQDQMPR